MRNGDRVRVWPHGDEDATAIGRVILISSNERSIAIAFDDSPPFLNRAGGFMIHPEHGIMFLANREDVGPWVELHGRGHYEIEPE